MRSKRHCAVVSKIIQALKLSVNQVLCKSSSLPGPRFPKGSPPQPILKLIDGPRVYCFLPQTILFTPVATDILLPCHKLHEHLICGPLFPAPGQLELWISEPNHCPGLVFVPGSYCRSHPSTILYLQSRRTCRPDLSWAALHLICVQ